MGSAVATWGLRGRQLDDQHQPRNQVVDNDELEGLLPYLDLARQIRSEVDRFVADEADDLDSLADALAAIPDRQRATIARDVFDRLPADLQWVLLERAFPDDELRQLLDAERARRLEVARRDAATADLLRDTAGTGRLDIRLLPSGTSLTVGLFRAVDVTAALSLGPASSVCARRVEFRTTDEPGDLRVIDDRFNPGRALFVTPEYDEAAWRAECFDSHETVRIGSSTDHDPDTFEPVLYLAARVDAEIDGALVRGRLHLGYALVGDDDAFAARP